MRKKLTPAQIAKKHGYKSGLEDTIADQIKEHEGDVQYEQHVIRYTIPSKAHKYKPDFKLKNGLYVETKGRFTLADRQKHLYIKDQYPHVEIRFVFTNPNAKLRKGSNTTYADWCIKNGFQFSKGAIPGEWYE